MPWPAHSQVQTEDHGPHWRNLHSEPQHKFLWTSKLFGLALRGVVVVETVRTSTTTSDTFVFGCTSHDLRIHSQPGVFNKLCTPNSSYVSCKPSNELRKEVWKKDITSRTICGSQGVGKTCACTEDPTLYKLVLDMYTYVHIKPTPSTDQSWLH